MIRNPQALLNATCQSLAGGSTESAEKNALYGNEVESWMDEIIMRDDLDDDEEFEDEDDEDDEDEDDEWDDDDDDWDDEDEEEEDDDEDMSALPIRRRVQSTRLV